MMGGLEGLGWKQNDMRATRHLASLTSLAALAFVTGGCLSTGSPPAEGLLQPAGPRPLVGWLAGPAGCLLYTSDAADE